MQRTIIKNLTQHIGEINKIDGWVQTIRSHGKIIFFDLRDRSGLVQIVFSPTLASKVEGQKSEAEIYELARETRPEWVVEIIGKVQKRPKGMENPKIETGNIEIEAQKLKILSRAKTLPFPIDSDGYEINNEKRLRYRYLDLRRKRLQRNLEIRQRATSFMRNFLQKRGFWEIETPILTKSTPEGARDFVVPSRLQAGEFYALPQSPQQYKQMLMVAGIEKYFQIARCLRDEDPRADRQAEHTQLDIEMSFVEQGDILKLIEELYKNLVETIFPKKDIIQFPFPRILYKEAMEKYKTDKPDIRQEKDKNNPDKLAFCFVTDFPMFEWKEGEKRWGAMHHPFTMPQTNDVEEIKKHPEKILAYQYDLVLNGYEIGGGSIRTTDLDILTAVFKVLGHKEEEIKKQFSDYFEAFSYGVPPHGGIASGIDRFLATALNEPNIREVIAFPKTGDSRDLMMNAPSEISEKQLKELHLKTIKSKKELK